jgi:hypothetical protein
MSGRIGRRFAASEPLRRSTRGRSTRGARAATIAVLATLVLAACGTSTSSPTPTAMATPQVGDVGWETYGGAGLPRQSVLPSEMAVRNGTVVLVGLRSGSTDSAATLPLWASTNGGSWTPATVAGAATGAPMSVVAFADGFVAVGTDGCQASFYTIALRGCRPAIWRSADGMAWTRISLTEPVYAELTAVTTWQDGLLAVGAQPAAGDASRLLPVLLRSTDGTTWQPLTPNSALDGPLTDVATDGDLLIVVGPRSSASAVASATAWSSLDAISWTREPLPGAAQGTQWVAVSAMPGGFGALDVRPSTAVRVAGALWRRDTSWHAITGTQEIGGARLMSIAAGPFGAVAVGLDEAYRPVVYASQDGSAWGPVSPVGALPVGSFGLISATWADGRFLVSGINLVTYQPMVLAGMAYVPRPGEVPYVTPAPTPSPTPGPTPMPPSAYAVGSASVSLPNLAGFAATKGGSTQCQSSPGSQAVVRIDLYDVGTLSGQPVRGGISFPAGTSTGAAAQIDLTALRVDNANEAATSYAWAGSVSAVAADGRSGTVTLDRKAGTVTWSCSAWIDPTARAGFFGLVGQLSLATKTSGWQSLPGPAQCGPELSGEIGQVSGVIGSLNGEAVSMELPLQGRSRVGQPIVATLRGGGTPDRMVRALVTLTRVTPGDVSGTGTFSLRFVAPVEGWPDRVDGTLTWRCPGRTDTDAKPMAACKVANGPAPGANLAAGASSTVSAELASEPRSAAFDGDMNRAWNAGTYAIQWIEVDLGKPVQVGELRLTVAQTPAGRTEHHLYGRATPDGPLVELTACGGLTSDSMTLVMTVSPDAKPMRYLRIETVASPSWVAWREIQVFAASE